MTIWLATVTSAACGALFVGVLWGLICGIVAFAALRTDRGWQLLRFGCVVSIGGAAGFVVIQQWRHRYGLGGDWPQHFSAVSPLAMFGYGLLGIECVVEALRAGWRRTADIAA